MRTTGSTCRRFSGGPLAAAALLASTALGMGLAATPALAQDTNADAELKALIPDAAVARPEEWAKGPPAMQANDVPPSAADDLAPSSPLAVLPELTVPWPEEVLALPELASLEPEPGIDEALAAAEQAAAPLPPLPEGDITVLSPQLSLAFPPDPAAFPQRAAFEDRFRSLSSLIALGGGDADNIAQVAVRARADRDLLTRLLRIEGYYDSDVMQTIGGIEPGQVRGADGAKVRFDVVPGARYRFGEIALGDLAQTGADYPALRASFGLQPGDFVQSDRIVVAQGSLDRALGETGFAFAKVGEPDLLIDHLRVEGDLTVPVTTGGKYRFGMISSDLPDFLSGHHLSEIARFDTGDLYQRSDVEDLNRAILATGLVSSVSIAPRQVRAPAGGEPGEVALDVSLSKAPLRTIAGAAGYDSGDGFRLEGSWEHRNLFPPEGLLRVRGVLGTKEQLAGVTFRRNNFRGRDQVLTVDAYASNANRTAYSARTVALSATFEKLTTLIFQKPWTWSIGAEVLATNEREALVKGAPENRLTYLIAALPMRAAYDSSDDLLDPTRGFRVGLRISPEFSRDQRENHAYARVQADASAYVPVGGRVVVAGRVRFGSIPGTDIANIAPSRRFYAGGGGSVRGYGYQQIGPRDAAGEPSGGRSLSEFSLEARVKTGMFGGALSVVPFIDAGSVEVGATPRLRDMRFGAGIGIRYQTGFGPIRVDIGTPLNRREGDSRVAVYVALGQAF